MSGPEPDGGLRRLGLRSGDEVRFRKRHGEHWLRGVVTGREADGSIELRDQRGRSRAIRPERIEVAEHGPRGGRAWTPLTDLAARTEQLGLFGD